MTRLKILEAMFRLLHPILFIPIFFWVIYVKMRRRANQRLEWIRMRRMYDL